jgi:fermentation-respiration switch protein FrsA (DUF1100 family)
VRHALHTTPAEYGLSYENVAFKGVPDGVPLSGWYIDSPGTSTIIITHGSNTVRDNYIVMEISTYLVGRGYDVFTFDFRGHGASGGSTGSLGPWEARDIAGALAYLKGRGVTRLGALGHSMGAAAILLAAPDQPEIAAIVADSSFADLFTILDRERSKAGIPSLFTPGVLMASKAFFGVDPLTNEPREAVSRLDDRPLLIIHSSVDDLIPPSEAYKLREAAAGNPNADLWVAPGNAHVSAFAMNKEEYLQRVAGFFDRNLGTLR